MHLIRLEVRMADEKTKPVTFQTVLITPFSTLLEVRKFLDERGFGPEIKGHRKFSGTLAVKNILGDWEKITGDWTSSIKKTTTPENVVSSTQQKK